MKVGVEVIFNDLTKDHIDPVDFDDFQSMVDDVVDMYVIDNGYHVYTYKVKDVQSINTYPLYECCGYDARDEYHSLRCANRE